MERRAPPYRATPAIQPVVIQPGEKARPDLTRWQGSRGPGEPLPEPFDRPDDVAEIRQAQRFVGR